MAKNKVIAGVLLGAVAGAAIAYLITTPKGKELLSNLQDAAGTAGDKARDLYDNAKSTVSETFKKGKKYSDEVQNTL